MIDNLDQKILRALESNARQSKAAIAWQLQVSKTVVTYRINRLEKKGIIKGYEYISNQAALGLSSFGLLIKFQGLFFEEQQQILRRMGASKKFDWVVATNGRWDAMAVSVESGALAFNNLLVEFFAQYGQYIKEYNFYIDYAGSISGHNYLYTEPFPAIVAYSNTGTDVALSPLEASIFKILQASPKLPLTSIAKRLGKTYDTIQAKYQSLVAKNILLKSVPVINHRALGYEDTICLFNLAPHPAKLSMFLAFCEEHPNIVRYSRCLGHVNVILNIHSRDGKHLKEILGVLNKKFSDSIISVDLIQVIPT